MDPAREPQKEQQGGIQTTAESKIPKQHSLRENYLDQVHIDTLSPLQILTAKKADEERRGRRG
jgi:hypothetical protein